MKPFFNDSVSNPRPSCDERYSSRNFSHESSFLDIWNLAASNANLVTYQQ